MRIILIAAVTVFFASVTTADEISTLDDDCRTVTIRPLRARSWSPATQQWSNWVSTQLYEGAAGGSPFGPCVGALVYDATEVDPVTGQARGGTCLDGPTDEGSRILIGGGDSYRTNVWVEDFRVPPYGGQEIGAIIFRIFWDPPLPSEQLYVILTIYDTYSFDCVLFPAEIPALPFHTGDWPATNGLWQVVLDYGNVSPTRRLQLLADFCDLTDDLPLPSDGYGAYSIMVAQDIDWQSMTFIGSEHPSEVGIDRGLGSPRYAAWGFRNDGNAPNGLWRPGQPDPSPPGEGRVWVNYCGRPTDPVAWDQDECREFGPFEYGDCYFVTTEACMSMWARQPYASVVSH